QGRHPGGPRGGRRAGCVGVPRSERGGRGQPGVADRPPGGRVGGVRPGVGRRAGPGAGRPGPAGAGGPVRGPPAGAAEDPAPAAGAERGEVPERGHGSPAQVGEPLRACTQGWPDRVWIEDANGGVVEERDTPRASFAGHVLATPWDKLQELYFVSYALWNYLATPFVFTEPGFETRELGPHEENGETWHSLLVKFPPSIPTHCAEQTLYFNAQGLLQRMDYSVDVVGDTVAGAASHYCFDHTPFGGIVIPTLRRAVSRTPKGAVLSGPTGVLLQMSDIKLIPNAPKVKNNDR